MGTYVCQAFNDVGFAESTGKLQVIGKLCRNCTLNRKTLTSFVRTKPRGSVVITKPLALRMSLSARKASWLYYMDLYH